MRTFFAQAAWDRLEARWRQMFDLAWDGKGFTIALEHVPDRVLNLFTIWRNERVEAENAQR